MCVRRRGHIIYIKKRIPLQTKTFYICLFFFVLRQTDNQSNCGEFTEKYLVDFLYSSNLCGGTFRLKQQHLCIVVVRLRRRVLTSRRGNKLNIYFYICMCYYFAMLIFIYWNGILGSSFSACCCFFCHVIAHVENKCEVF